MPTCRVAGGGNLQRRSTVVAVGGVPTKVFVSRLDLLELRKGRRCRGGALVPCKGALLHCTKLLLRDVFVGHGRWWRQCLAVAYLHSALAPLGSLLVVLSPCFPRLFSPNTTRVTSVLRGDRVAPSREPCRRCPIAGGQGTPLSDSRTIFAHKPSDKSPGSGSIIGHDAAEASLLVEGKPSTKFNEQNEMGALALYGIA